MALTLSVSVCHIVKTRVHKFKGKMKKQKYLKERVRNGNSGTLGRARNRGSLDRRASLDCGVETCVAAVEDG